MSDQRIICNLWNRYLNEVLKHFAKDDHPPTQAQIEMWKANFFAGAFAAIDLLSDSRLIDSPRLYQLVKSAKEEITREAEAHMAQVKEFIQ